ncbi:MAG: hypothetical protein WDZ51_18270 [Pirellulaceae bacterium]
MIERFPRLLLGIVVVVAGCAIFDTRCQASQLYVGGASVSITPDQPVALSGQRHLRIATKVVTPCIATALAVETRDGERSLEQTMFVTCDLVAIRGGESFYDEVRELLDGRVPDEVVENLIINATHTHTGPVSEPGRYDIPKEGVIQPEEYRAWLMARLADIVTEAWEKRAPAKMAWGLGHAVLAQNRRAVYANGTAKMYGGTNQSDFRGLEGNEDHGVEILYFWNMEDQLMATAINVACPSQEVGSNRTVDADFWHPVRESIKSKFGQDVQILAWTGAAGDQASREMYRKEAEQRMRQLRGMDGVSDLARRIVATWEDVYEVVKQDQHTDVVHMHHAEKIQLPLRAVTEDEHDNARDAIAAMSPKDPAFKWSERWHGSVVQRYQQQQKEPMFFEMELRCVRLGDIAIATNDFELFTDFGVQIKARSPAIQTFVIQLCGSGSYIPTVRGVAGGGYSAIVESSVVGPVGAQVLVNETVKSLDTIWKRSAKSAEPKSAEQK